MEDKYSDESLQDPYLEPSTLRKIVYGFTDNEAAIYDSPVETKGTKKSENSVSAIEEDQLVNQISRYPIPHPLELFLIKHTPPS